MRDMVLPEPAEPKPTATSTLFDPVTPEQAPAEVVRAPVEPVKILLFSTNTKDGDQLPLDEAYHAIEQRNPDLAKPVVEIQRGAYAEFGSAQSGVKADPDGIVVLHYELKHMRWTP